MPPRGHLASASTSSRGRAVLERVAARAGVEPAEQQLLVGGAGVEHDPPLGSSSSSAARQGDAVVLAEADVDERDVGRELLDEPAALVGGARRADDVAALAVEQQLEALAQRLMVFDEDEAQRHTVVYIGSGEVKP